jgi:hypothetical protein
MTIEFSCVYCAVSGVFFFITPSTRFLISPPSSAGTRRAAVQVQEPCLQSRSPLHIFDFLMSLQSAVPLQLHPAGEKIVPAPDSHLNAEAGDARKQQSSAAFAVASIFCMIFTFQKTDASLRPQLRQVRAAGLKELARQSAAARSARPLVNEVYRFYLDEFGDLAPFLGARA